MLVSDSERVRVLVVAEVFDASGDGGAVEFERVRFWRVSRSRPGVTAATGAFAFAGSGGCNAVGSSDWNAPLSVKWARSER